MKPRYEEGTGFEYVRPFKKKWHKWNVAGYSIKSRVKRGEITPEQALSFLTALAEREDQVDISVSILKWLRRRAK